MKHTQVDCVIITNSGTITSTLQEFYHTAPVISERKVTKLLSKEVYPTINLEITLPRITFPTINKHIDPNASKTQTEQHPSENRGQFTDEQVQIRLLSLAIHSLAEQIPTLPDENFAISTRKGHFHLQRIKHIVAQGQRYLLQILRQGQQKQTLDKEDHGQSCVTDELVFSLTYQHVHINATQHIEIIPGLNQIVILLDNENIPISYNIDGAEN